MHLAGKKKDSLCDCYGQCLKLPKGEESKGSPNASATPNLITSGLGSQYLLNRLLLSLRNPDPHNHQPPSASKPLFTKHHSLLPCFITIILAAVEVVLFTVL